IEMPSDRRGLPIPRRGHSGTWASRSNKDTAQSDRAQGRHRELTGSFHVPLLQSFNRNHSASRSEGRDVAVTNAMDVKRRPDWGRLSLTSILDVGPFLWRSAAPPTPPPRPASPDGERFRRPLAVAAWRRAPPTRSERP